jgi:hypothetical protein
MEVGRERSCVLLCVKRGWVRDSARSVRDCVRVCVCGVRVRRAVCSKKGRRFRKATAHRLRRNVAEEAAVPENKHKLH